MAGECARRLECYKEMWYDRQNCPVEFKLYTKMEEDCDKWYNRCQISNSVLFWFVCGVKAKEPAMRLFIKAVGF